MKQKPYLFSMITFQQSPLYVHRTHIAKKENNDLVDSSWIFMCWETHRSPVFCTNFLHKQHGQLKCIDIFFLFQ